MHDFKEGELIGYMNGTTLSIGKIKKLVDGGAFVYYHTGETAAKTSFANMHKIENAHCIMASNFGKGERLGLEGLAPILSYCRHLSRLVCHNEAKHEGLMNHDASVSDFLGDLAEALSEGDTIDVAHDEFFKEVYATIVESYNRERGN